MKKDINYVDRAKLEAICQEKGVPMTQQAGFVKCQGKKGRNVYIGCGPAAKRAGRVDVSGFTYEGPGVLDLTLDRRPTGNVLQGLDFSPPEADILANFAALLDHMLSLPEAEPVKRVSPMGGAKKAAAKEATKEAGEEAPPVDAEKRRREVAAAIEISKRRGASLSPKLRAEAEAFGLIAPEVEEAIEEVEAIAADA